MSKENDPVLVHEECLGLDELTDDLVRCFKQSCAHNYTTVDDTDYYRRYMFFLIAGIIKKQQAINALLKDEE